jgi:hypothetical protein
MNQHLRSLPEYGPDSPPAVFDAEERLRDCERRAWNAYFETSRTLDPTCSVEVTDEFLTTRVVPAFSKIGVDEAIVQALFGLASKAWGVLDTASEKVVRLHPAVHQEIDEVRQGLLAQADRKTGFRSGPAFLTPQEPYDRLQTIMDPANLHLLLDEITTPWIVLPRAYSSMRRDHIHYLPAYLEVIDNEANGEALHIFTRIAIEFLANFTIRFADERYPREQVVCLVTAGYTALFWKNLNTPPKGFEDIRIFKHFLAWLKHSGCWPKTPRHDLETIIQASEARKAVIFPRLCCVTRGGTQTP